MICSRVINNCGIPQIILLILIVEMLQVSVELGTNSSLNVANILQEAIKFLGNPSLSTSIEKIYSNLPFHWNIRIRPEYIKLINEIFKI